MFWSGPKGEDSDPEHPPPLYGTKPWGTLREPWVSQAHFASVGASPTSPLTWTEDRTDLSGPIKT